MKRLFVFLLILGIYLNRSYAYFYNFLSQHSLVAPTHEETMIVGSSPRLQTIKYIALGDSLTAGVGVSDYKNSLDNLVRIHHKRRQLPDFRMCPARELRTPLGKDY